MSGAESDAGTGAARSQAWYAGDGRDAFIHRAWMRRGLPDHAFDGRPQIVICNTWSDLTVSVRPSRSTTSTPPDAASRCWPTSSPRART